MAKKKAVVAAAQPATTKKFKSLGAYIDHSFENRQWYVRSADCLKAGTVKFYTGHLDLDMSLLGGFPYGKMSLVSGADSTGKTTLILRLIARMLRTCRTCFTPIIDFTNYETGEVKTACQCGGMLPMNGVLVDAEDRYDPVWGSKQGLPISSADALNDHLIVIKPSTGELVTDSVRQMMQDNMLDFIAVDSYAALFPESREGRLAGAQMPGDAAKMTQNLLLTILHENMREGAQTKRRCTVFGTQQLRANIGQMYGPQTMVPGGWFLKHGLTTHIAMKRPKLNEGIDKKKMTDGSTHYVDFEGEIMKASLGGKEHNHTFWRIYTKPYSTFVGGDSDEAKRVIEALNLFKMVSKTKEGYTLLGLPFATIADMMNAVKQNETFSLVARFVLLYNQLPEDSRGYLDIERFNYDPFYELVFDESTPPVTTEETADAPEAKLTKFRLVARNAPGQDRKKPRAVKDDKVANSKLAQINPPNTPATDG